MNDEWETPQDLFDKLDGEFDFDVDLCTSSENSRCPVDIRDIWEFVDDSEFSDQFDGFWMNPPYSRGNIDMCMAQAVKLADRGKTVVCLVRFDPSTQWFQKYVHGVATEVRMMDRRVKFRGADSAYNFPTCIVVYEDTGHGNTEYSLWGWK